MQSTVSSGSQKSFLPNVQVSMLFHPVNNYVLSSSLSEQLAADHGDGHRCQHHCDDQHLEALPPGQPRARQLQAEVRFLQASEQHYDEPVHVLWPQRSNAALHEGWF